MEKPASHSRLPDSARFHAPARYDELVRVETLADVRSRS